MSRPVSEGRNAAVVDSLRQVAENACRRSRVATSATTAGDRPEVMSRSPPPTLAAWLEVSAGDPTTSESADSGSSPGGIGAGAGDGSGAGRAYLVHHFRDEPYNRSSFVVAGRPGPVASACAALAFAALAALPDLGSHDATHPRIGEAGVSEEVCLVADSARTLNFASCGNCWPDMTVVCASGVPYIFFL